VNKQGILKKALIAFKEMPRSYSGLEVLEVILDALHTYGIIS